jgi:4-hydroxyphenylacetate 3-monooxygenase
VRSGADFIESVRDGREVWLDGERVKDITTHPAFRNTTRSLAHLYDLAHSAELRDELTTLSPYSDRRIHRAFQVAATRADLIAKRKAFKTVSEASFGFLGRSPDYMAAAAAGFAAAPQAFTGAVFDGAANVLAYHRRLAENDLFQAHTLVNPQIDRTKAASEQEENDLYLRVVRERDDGIIVRGAKMMGTGAVFGDEILVGVTQPLAPGEADYALSFSVPVSTPGVKFISRVSYEAAASSVFDNPLASRFDENDALVVYDNVFVPWENVLVYRDVEVCRAQWWQTCAFVNLVHHGATRLWTKLEFLTGLAILIAKANNTYGLPPVKAQIGRLIGWLNVLRSMVLGMEAECEPLVAAPHLVQPNKEIGVAQLAIGPEIYPKVLAEIKLLAGGGLIQLPSSYRDLLSPEIEPVIARYIRSPGHDSQRRVKLFKLAWDALGSEFAGRHDQYERFYHGAPHVYLNTIAREADTDRYERLATACMEGYQLDEQ